MAVVQAVRRETKITLLEPQRPREKHLMNSISRAAQLLNTSELQLLNEAWLTWFGGQPREQEIIDVFSQLMISDKAPDWADKFAKSVLADLEAHRQVNLNSFATLNMTPRVGPRPKITFSVDR